MSFAFPGESAEYRAARGRLLAQEVELRRAMESVAADRRELPLGGVVPDDYAETMARQTLNEGWFARDGGERADRGGVDGVVSAGAEDYDGSGV